MNAIYVWGLARALGGTVLVRIEDHDHGRCRPEYVDGLLEDLEWLGLEPDRDESTGDKSFVIQSARTAGYVRALDRLDAAGLVYPCVCSRRDIVAAVGEEADAFGAEVPYPGTCARARVDPTTTSARRVRLDEREERFDDVALAVQRQSPSQQCGDLLVRERSGRWTYHFAVVVDDHLQNVDVVIRGADLLESTGRQLALARLLGRESPPVFLHHPLVRREGGLKLSKSDGDTGLRDLRRSGWSAERVLGEAARLGGLQPDARTIAAVDLPGLFVG